jgi:hypothetical protein
MWKMSIFRYSKYMIWSFIVLFSTCLASHPGTIHFESFFRHVGSMPGAMEKRRTQDWNTSFYAEGTPTKINRSVLFLYHKSHCTSQEVL